MPKHHTNSKEKGAAQLILILSFIIGLIGLLGFLAFSSLQKKKADASTSVATYINVATYNLRSQRWDGTSDSIDPWSQRAPRVKAIISRELPGIIGMQEVIKYNPDTGKYVSQRNDVINFMQPMGYGYIVGSVDNSSPIFWKTENFLKLASGEVMIFDAATSQRADPPATRYLSYARLQQKNHKKNVLVLNYHFNQFEQRDRQLSRLASSIRSLRTKYPSDDVFFTGDFNKAHTDIIAELNNIGLRLRVADGSSGIDHVLVSPGVSVRTWVSSGLGSPAASDHPMITAKLTI